MTVAASVALISELDKAVNGRSPHRRAEILRKVTALFLSDADRFSEDQLGVFDDVLVRLIERVGARDNFFRLNGNSLIALQAISRVQAVLLSAR